MKIGFIGGGNLASAIIGGLVKSGFINGEDIFVSDKDASKISPLESLKVNVSSDNIKTVNEADIIIFAVKPNILPLVLNETKEHLLGKLVVSIAAGTMIKDIEAIIGDDKKIVRVMPNTPAQVNCGMAVICPNANADGEDKDAVCKIFDAVGSSVILDEKYINAATALHGSSPAYIYMLIDAMANCGVKYGIPKDISLMLVSKAVEGSAKMVSETKIHPAKLCDNVCSPGGTTIEAVNVLEECGFKSAVQKAIDACVKKAEEMSK